MSIPILTFASTQPSTPSFQIPNDHRQIAELAVREILECRFDNALRLTDSVYSTSGNDKNPLAAVLHLAALGMRDVDFDTTIDAAAFARSFERAGAAVSNYEDQHGKTSYSLTLKGFALAMNASFHLKNRSYVKAGENGLDAISALKKAQGLDSSNTEVNFFLGLYDYVRADLKKQLSGIPFWFPGDKNTGMLLLEDGAQTAVITKTAPALALVDIYTKEKQTRRARELIYILKREMPQSRFVLWAEAKHCESQKMYRQAAAAYGKLAESYKNEPYGRYNRLVTLNRQAHMHGKAGEKELAVNVCKQVLEFVGGDDRRVDPLIRDTRKLLERLGR